MDPFAGGSHVSANIYWMCKGDNDKIQALYLVYSVHFGGYEGGAETLNDLPSSTLILRSQAIERLESELWLSKPLPFY